MNVQISLMVATCCLQLTVSSAAPIFFLSCNMSPVCLIFSYFGMTFEKINSPIRMTENLLCKLARFYVTREEIKEDD